MTTILSTRQNQSNLSLRINRFVSWIGMHDLSIWIPSNNYGWRWKGSFNFIHELQQVFWNYGSVCMKHSILSLWLSATKYMRACHVEWRPLYMQRANGLRIEWHIDIAIQNWVINYLVCLCVLASLYTLYMCLNSLREMNKEHGFN
jgi:hypothetical protein